MNAILKYPGAKWSLAEWIISHFPPHHSYLEPFFGSGAVLFNKSRSNIETVNDIDGEVVNLFDCIRRDPGRIARMVYFTPYSRQEFDRSCLPETQADPFDRAVRFLIRCNQGHGFRTNEYKVGWKNDVQGRERAYAAKNWADLPEVIVQAADRMRGVQIECRPAVELISHFNAPNVLIYCDPPYVLSSRSSGKRQYKHEMTNRDHEELLAVMKPILFNTEMVRATLEGLKTVMRRVVKPQPFAVKQDENAPCWCGHFVSESGKVLLDKPPYCPGEILYVRETWQNGFGGTYLYKADAEYDLFMTPEGKLVSDIPWRPSIHMPREAARIFLRVTDLRVERVQDIDDDGVVAEGLNIGDPFDELWNSTIKPADRDLYGWGANPWVWVIEFEWISREEAEQCQ